MTPAQIKRLEAVEATIAKAEDSAADPDFVDDNFPVQKQLLLDTASLLVVLCTRRAAKSFSAAKRLLRAMYKHPGCSCLFIALTRESAKKILWKDALKVINRKWKLGAKFNETDLTMTLQNGSVLYLLGVDTTDDEKEKLLGQKYAEVAVDESASFTIDLFQLVFSILKPGVADYRGTIGLYGTPGNLKKGLFFDLTRGQDPQTPGQWMESGWSGHRWNTFANPYMAENWRAEIEELKAINPHIEETPFFQQNYLGRWVIDETKLVYRYQMGRNDFNGELPELNKKGDWHYVLGIDLGFNDATSFTIAAYHDFDKTLYFMSSHKQSGLDITATSEHAQALKSKWPIDTTVIDGTNKQAVEELNKRHGLEAQPADNTGKADFIDIMNAELIQGRIKLSPDCQPLKDEYAGLIWDERALAKLQRKEHPGCENHCTDGALYGWRWCWQYLAAAAPTPPAVLNTPEWYAEQQRTAMAELEKGFEEQFQRNKQQEREDREQREWD